MAWSCSKTIGICIVILALIRVCHKSNGSFLYHWYFQYYRICQVILLERQGCLHCYLDLLQNHFSYFNPHSKMAAFLVTQNEVLALFSVVEYTVSMIQRGLRHCASFFMVGNAHVRSNNLACTLKGTSWNAIGH